MNDQTQQLQALRRRERLEEFQQTLQVCSSKMSLPLYMAFWFADLVYAQHLKWEFLALRSLMIPINLAIFARITRVNNLEHIEDIGLLFTFANSILITIMIYVTEGVASPYYAGLNLVAVGILSFFPWSYRKLPVAILVIYAPYYTLGLLLPHSGEGLRPLIISSFFIGGNVIACLVKHHFTEQLRKKEIISRLQLHNEIDSREQIIKDKTVEALHLSALAKQFSPQVVQAIQSGQLDIMKGNHQSNICAIFIDIVDSTDHVLRIDVESMNRVLSMFMEDTMRVLLKYDITIDKFLGDGVLAFSNDPVQHDDFVQRVVNAALEIRLRIQNRRLMYAQYWQSELQIRIGIACGCANVGFYGHDEYFKSYTAIGRVINLASRLCAAARPNQILLSQDVAEKLARSTYSIQCIGTPSLKGFESEPVKAYELVQFARPKEKIPEISTCPRQHGVLHLDNTESGIYVFKCRVCGYVLNTDSAAPSQSQDHPEPLRLLPHRIAAA